MDNTKVTRILAKFAFELIIIIAGIWIALFVNGVQQRREDRKRLESTLLSLSMEFQKNIGNIDKIQPRLERFRDTLEYYSKRNDLSIYDLTLKSPGLTTADIYSTNWRAILSNSSLQLLDFETITLLSQIEAKHQELKDQADILLSMVYQPSLYKNGDEGAVYKKILGVWLGGYLGNERELIELYTQFDGIVKQYNRKL